MTHTRTHTHTHTHTNTHTHKEANLVENQNKLKNFKELGLTIACLIF